MIHNLKRITAMAALAIAALPAHAQFGPGRMMPSTIDPNTYKPGYKHQKDWPAPQPGYTGGVRVLPGGGYCGPGVIIINGGYCAPGYYGGYGNPGYGSYGYSGYSVGVNLGGVRLGYQQYQQQRNSYIEQYVPPVVPYGGDSAYRRDYDRAGADRSVPREQPTLRRNKDDDSDNDYYLHRKPGAAPKDAGLTEAIADITAAFRTGDTRRLEKHIDRAGTVTVQSLGRSRQQLAASDYLQMTGEALKVMKTSRYTLDKVEPASNGSYLVFGTHVIRGEDGGEKTFNVGFVLEKKGENWLIKEVSADPAK
jgi:hypothetical protein